MKKIWFIGVLIIVVLISGCTYGPKTQTISQPTATPAMPTVTATETAGMITETATPATTPATTPAPVSVEIRDYSFNPATIPISKGTTVTWTNKGSVQHTVTGSGFDSGNLNTGETFSWTFNKAGTFTYGCSNHPSMTGTVTVT